MEGGQRQEEASLTYVTHTHTHIGGEGGIMERGQEAGLPSLTHAHMGGGGGGGGWGGGGGEVQEEAGRAAGG